MTAPLGDLATMVRSKNAGPFWLTIDMFFPDPRTYERVWGSLVTDERTIAEMFHVDAAQVKVFGLASLLAIKISFPRPVTQGSIHDRDMHAGQQYVPLLGMLID